MIAPNTEGSVPLMVQEMYDMGEYRFLPTFLHCKEGGRKRERHVLEVHRVPGEAVEVNKTGAEAQKEVRGKAGTLLQALKDLEDVFVDAVLEMCEAYSLYTPTREKVWDTLFSDRDIGINGRSLGPLGLL